MMTTNNIRPEKRTGLMRIVYATKYSLEGMKATFATEAAFRQEVLITCVSVPLALVMPISFLFKAFLIGSTIALLIIELLNTAIESIGNMVTQEFHPLVKRAKDTGSAAVMLGLINLFVAWLLALLQAF